MFDIGLSYRHTEIEGLNVTTKIGLWVERASHVNDCL